MAYQVVDEAGVLSVHISGDVDALTVAILDAHLHLIVEKCAFHSLRAAGVVEKSALGLFGARSAHGFPTRPLVRLGIVHVEAGSLLQNLRLLSTTVLGDPFAREVLANVLSDAVGAIARSGIMRVLTSPTAAARRGGSGVDVGPNVRAIAEAALANSNDKRVRLVIRVTKDGATEECELEVGE